MCKTFYFYTSFSAIRNINSTTDATWFIEYKLIYVREHALGRMIFSNKNSQPIVLGQLKCIESLYFFKNLNYYRNPSVKKQ